MRFVGSSQTSHATMAQSICIYTILFLLHSEIRHTHTACKQLHVNSVHILFFLSRCRSSFASLVGHRIFQAYYIFLLFDCSKFFGFILFYFFFRVIFTRYFSFILDTNNVRTLSFIGLVNARPERERAFISFYFKNHSHGNMYVLAVHVAVWICLCLCRCLCVCICVRIFFVFEQQAFILKVNSYTQTHTDTRTLAHLVSSHVFQFVRKWLFLFVIAIHSFVIVVFFSLSTTFSLSFLLFCLCCWCWCCCCLFVLLLLTNHAILDKMLWTRNTTSIENQRILIFGSCIDAKRRIKTTLKLTVMIHCLCVHSIVRKFVG